METQKLVFADGTAANKSFKDDSLKSLLNPQDKSIYQKSQRETVPVNIIEENMPEVERGFNNRDSGDSVGSHTFSDHLKEYESQEDPENRHSRRKSRRL